MLPNNVMPDNLMHLIAATVVAAMTVLLIIFAYGFINPDYVFSTGSSIITVILGYHFGADANASTPPVIPQGPVTNG